MYFNPRSPRGGATKQKFARPNDKLFQSTLPTRGSDQFVVSVICPKIHFNPRSPRGGATRSCSSTVGGIAGFQSTLPTRGSDHAALTSCGSYGHFNPRSPRGGATQKAHFFTNILSFQSTLPTRGSDAEFVARAVADRNFNPRSPRGGATFSGAGIAQHRRISIHAPHEGERRNQHL